MIYAILPLAIRPVIYVDLSVFCLVSRTNNIWPFQNPVSTSVINVILYNTGANNDMC